MVKVLYGRFGPQLSTTAIIDALPLCFATVMDVVSAHVFGLAIAPNLTGNRTERISYIEAFKNDDAPRSMFWAQEIPSLHYLFARTRWARKTESYLEAEILRLCERAEAVLIEGVAHDVESPMLPGLYRFLRQASMQSAWTENYNQLEIASEILDHLKATGEVLSIALLYALYELSKNQQMQTQLRSEVRKSWGRTEWERRYLPSSESLDRSSFLDAVVCETLRLRPTIPDGQPRLNKSTSTAIHGIKYL
jgi:cytochrome P450